MDGEIEIGKEYEFDGRFVKVLEIRGDQALVESRFGSCFLVELYDLESK